MYKSLQASRAVAAILVVLYHLGSNIASPKYFNLPYIALPFSFGHAGVEFFFVLSGFIILTAHRRDISHPERLGAYVQKRLLRIYPGYWLAFLGVLAVSLLLPSMRSAVPADPMVIFKALLLLPQDPAVAGLTGAPLIIVAWTLHYELLFYAWFALLIYSRRVGVLIGGILLFLCLSQQQGSAAQYFPISFFAQDYLLVFGLGMLACHWHAKNKASLPPQWLLAAGLLLVAVTAADTISMQFQLVGWRTMLYGSACAMIVLALVRLEDAGKTFGAHPWMQTLGDASYALYLIHLPLIRALSRVAKALHLDALGPLGALITYLGILVICLLAAVAFHRHLEKPLAARLRRAFGIAPAPQRAA